MNLNGRTELASPQKKGSVGIVRPRLGFGGSETKVLWTIEALKQDFDVTLITGGPVELDRLNRYYGTRLAPAETVKGGCITFVPNSGGQTEIVNHPALTFSNDEDAVSKICTVLSSAALQENLRAHLAGRARKFSVENFKSGIRHVVSELLGSRESRSNKSPEKTESCSQSL